MSQQTKETVVFLVHSVKQFSFGFERLDEVARHCETGSPALAFYLSAIYQHIAVFYLLDKGPQDAMGGTLQVTEEGRLGAHSRTHSRGSQYIDWFDDLWRNYPNLPKQGNRAFELPRC